MFCVGLFQSPSTLLLFALSGPRNNIISFPFSLYERGFYTLDIRTAAAGSDEDEDGGDDDDDEGRRIVIVLCEVRLLLIHCALLGGRHG